MLTHWGRVTHICVSRLTITGSANGLSPGRRQAIIWTNAGILLIGPLGTNFSENLIEILTFSFTKMRLKVSSAKWRLFCLGLNVLNQRTMTDIWGPVCNKWLSVLHVSEKVAVCISIQWDEITEQFMSHVPIGYTHICILHTTNEDIDQ